MSGIVDTRPGIVKGVAALALLVAGYCLWIGLGPVLSYFFGLLIGVQSQIDWNGNQFWWLPLGAFGIWAPRLLLRGRPNGPTMVVGFLAFAAGSLLGKLSNGILSVWDLAGGDEVFANPAKILSGYTGKDWSSILAFVAFMLMLMAVARVLLFDPQVRRRFGAEVESEHGFATRWKPAAAFTLASLFWIVSGYVPFLMETVLSSILEGPWYAADLMPPDLFAALPFVAAAGLLFWRKSERLLTDKEGIAIYLFRPKYKLFFARWDRIRFLDIVRHGSKPPTVVIHYRSRFGLPFSFGVHPDRYTQPKQVAADVLRAANEHEIKVRDWRSSPWVLVAGVAAFVMCVIFIRLGRDLSTGTMQSYVDGTIPAHDVAALFALMPLTKLFLAAVSCLGLGFGLHSAYHRGGPRPVLLVLLLAGVVFVPDPLLHWLVVMAINAILTAVQSLPSLHGSGGILTNVPSLSEFELAFSLVKAAPVFAGGAYILGVVLGRWPWRLIRYPRIAPQGEGEASASHRNLGPGEGEASASHNTLAVPQT